MIEKDRTALKIMIMEHGLQHVLEEMQDICEDIVTLPVSPKNKETWETRWKTAAGSLSYALRTISF